MTETERKALALVRDVADGYEDVSIHHVHNAKTLRSALCYAIEQHEAFRREVSDAVEHFKRCYPGYQHASLFDRFINLAHKSALRSRDWQRFYHFIWHCTVHNVHIDRDDVHRLLVNAGFTIEYAASLADIFEHGQALLKRGWKEEAGVSSANRYGCDIDVVILQVRLTSEGRFPAPFLSVRLVGPDHNAVFEQLDLGRQVVVVGFVDDHLDVDLLYRCVNDAAHLSPVHAKQQHAVPVQRRVAAPFHSSIEDILLRQSRRRDGSLRSYVASV